MKKGNRTETFTLRLTSQTKEQLTKISEDLGLSMAAVVTLLIKQHSNNKQNE